MYLLLSCLAWDTLYVKDLRQGTYVYTIVMFSMGHPVYKGLEAGYICIYYIVRWLISETLKITVFG